MRVVSIIRVNHTENYTVMSNRHLRDANLSLKAKGLLSQMLSLPDDWDYTVAGLVSINHEGQTAIENILRELKDAGYVVVSKRYPNETESGRIEYVYTVYESPDDCENGEKQEAPKQGVENLPLEILPVEIQPVENRPQLNTNIQSIDIQNKELQRLYLLSILLQTVIS